MKLSPFSTRNSKLSFKIMDFICGKGVLSSSLYRSVLNLNFKISTPSCIFVPSARQKILGFSWTHPAGIYLFKVNKRSTRTKCEVNDVVLVSILFTLNKFHTLFCCFCCWLWTSKCRLGKLQTKTVAVIFPGHKPCKNCMMADLLLPVITVSLIIGFYDHCLLCLLFIY